MKGCMTQGTLCSSCLLTHPAPTAPLQRGAGRAQCRQGSEVTSPASDELGKPKPSLSPCWLLASLSACLLPRATWHGPNVLVSIQQSIFKSQAVGPRNSNCASQPCAPANAKGAVFPRDIASHPMMEGSETASDVGQAELRLFSFLQGGYLHFRGRASTHWSISAPLAPLQPHPQPPALHYLKWDVLPR